MQYAILRVKKRSLQAAGAMARHALREDNTPNADPAKRFENTVLGPTSAAEVMARIRARTDQLVKRKDAVRCIELFIGASPEAMRGKSREQQDAYFKTAIRWVGQHFGQANMISAVIHRDETTPHLQMLLTPVVDGKLQANKLIGGPAGLKRMQDDFAAAVATHGLIRGERGSPAKHTSVKQFYAAALRAGSREALPQKVKVPRVPPAPKLGFLESDNEKAARQKAEKAHQAALKHNADVERQIREMAAVGLATHSRSRRSLAPRLANAEATIAEADRKLKLIQDEQARAERMTRAAAQLLRELPNHLAEQARRKIELEERVPKVERVEHSPAKPTRPRPGPAQ